MIKRYNLAKLTKIILITAVVALSLYDIVALINGGSEATISRITLSYSKEYPVIPFAVGVVCGHLFWPNKGAYDGHGKRAKEEGEGKDNIF